MTECTCDLLDNPELGTPKLCPVHDAEEIAAWDAADAVDGRAEAEERGDAKR